MLLQEYFPLKGDLAHSIYVLYSVCKHISNGFCARTH